MVATCTCLGKPTRLPTHSTSSWMTAKCPCRAPRTSLSPLAATQRSTFRAVMSPFLPAMAPAPTVGPVVVSPLPLVAGSARRSSAALATVVTSP